MVIVVVVIAAIVVTIMMLTRGKSGSLDQEKYRVQWLEIENGLDKNNLTTYQFGILAADKLLAQALKELDLKGDGISDQLKSVKNKLSNFNAILAAHKLRNKIAHETDVNVSSIDARRALGALKKALKELGAI
jgi:hypothetical protein